MFADADSFAHEINQRVAGLFSRRRRAGLVIATSAIGLARRDT
jgi:hypothetical protein